MCTMSMVAHDWHDRNPQYTPIVPYYQMPGSPFNQEPLDLSKLFVQPITRAAFDELKKELAAIKDLLLAAKKYNEATGQKDCEDKEKIKLFKRLAEITGVDLSKVFAKESA